MCWSRANVRLAVDVMRGAIRRSLIDNAMKPMPSMNLGLSDSSTVSSSSSRASARVADMATRKAIWNVGKIDNGEKDNVPTGESKKL